MPNPSVEDVLKGLSEVEASVLYLKCAGLGYESIAKRRSRSVPWVTWEMASVYHKLLLDKKDEESGKPLHKSVRKKILDTAVCPLLKKLVGGKSSNLKNFPLGDPAVIEEFPVEWLEFIEEGKEKAEVIEGVVEEPKKPPEELPPPPPEEFYPPVLYNAWLLVVEDDGPGVEPPKEEPIIIPSQLPGQQRRGDWRRILILASVIGCIGCLVVGVGAYRLGRGSFAAATETVVPTIQPTSTIEPSATIQITDTETPLPTDTLTPTLTFTPTATLTPIPTDTKSPIGLGLNDELRDDRVTLKLIDVAYNVPYDRLGQRIAPVGFAFDFMNHSGGTIIAQFDKSNFVVEDNTGRTAECWFYNVSGAVDKWNSTLNDGDTLRIATRCGDGRVPEGVTMYTLTVHPFTSLPESTWVSEVPH
jgi:hypothetical protein